MIGLKRSSTARRVAHSTIAAVFAAGLMMTSAAAQEKVTYLFPAPPMLPAFAPLQLAKGKGYFKDEGLDVDFQVARGGVEVAKQVGAGNAQIGGIVGDGPIMVRGNGVPVKIVALFGGKGFMQTVVREDSGINAPADLKGKTLTVLSYQDTTFYALLGLLASVGLTQNDVSVQSAGPTGVWESVATGKSVGMAGVPDWIALLEAQGTKIKILPTDQFFPHLAQGIAVSDKMIKDNPQMIQKFVRAAMRGMKDVMDDPNKAAEDFVKFVPEWKGKEQVVKSALNYYQKLVYVDQKRLGEINPDRLSKLQDFYVEKGIIQKKTPVEELYSNQFIQ